MATHRRSAAFPTAAPSAAAAARALASSALAAAAAARASRRGPEAAALVSISKSLEAIASTLADGRVPRDPRVAARLDSIAPVLLAQELAADAGHPPSLGRSLLPAEVVLRRNSACHDFETDVNVMELDDASLRRRQRGGRARRRRAPAAPAGDLYAGTGCCVQFSSAASTSSEASAAAPPAGSAAAAGPDAAAGSETPVLRPAPGLSFATPCVAKVLERFEPPQLGDAVPGHADPPRPAGDLPAALLPTGPHALHDLLASGQLAARLADFLELATCAAFVGASRSSAAPSS